MAKVFLHVSNRMTVGTLAKGDDVKRSMNEVIQQDCDEIFVHTKYNEGEEWESFTLQYNSVTPQLHAFITKVGDLHSCIIQYSRWQWTVYVSNISNSIL
jgi:hypothetical protein